jgi:hypothetical protein
MGGLGLGGGVWGGGLVVGVLVVGWEVVVMVKGLVVELGFVGEEMGMGLEVDLVVGCKMLNIGVLSSGCLMGMMRL